MASEPSALSDAVTVVRRAAAIVRERPSLIGRGMMAAFGVALASCFIGVPLLGKWMVSSYRIAMGRDEGIGIAWGTLTCAGLAHAATQTGALLAAAATIVIARWGTTTADGVAGSIVVAAACVLVSSLGALASVVATSAAMRDGLASGLGRVIAVLGSRPGTLALAIGTQILTQLAGAVAIALGFHAWPALGGSLALVWVGTTHIAFAAATEEVVLAPRATDRFAPPIGRVAATLAIPVGVFALALAAAALTPVAAWNIAPDALREGRVLNGRSVLREEGGLTVDVRWAGDDERAVWITTADGGGAGRVDGLDGGLLARRTTYRGRAAWEIGDPGGLATYVDDDGVRLDDGLADRLRERALPVPALLVAVAALLVAVLAHRLRRARSYAALLASGPALDAADATVVVTGTLRLDDGASVALARDGHATVRGVVRFESADGTRTFALPEGKTALDAPHDAVIETGTPAFAFFASRELRARSYRDAASAQPLAIGVGSLDRAREAFLVHASRALLRLALPAGALFLAAALVLVVRTL